MTRVRVGVDVGGTFTKAVAVELAGHSIVASVVVPTTHTADGGVAAGVVQAVAELADKVGAGNIDLVTHSTTQAVNALIEGDAGEVGVIGMGRRPDLSRVEKRTRLRSVDIVPGKRLRVRHAFFDVTDGFPERDVRAALIAFRDAGVAAVCVAEAFSPDDPSNEIAVAAIANELALPVCASTDLSGLYGLELRTITAALNASILPIAVSTASFVADGVKAAGIEAPVMVMRSDGGATDLDGFSAAPVRTLYSGPSASVAGALRFTRVTNAVVLEVGGTSTNIAAIRGGRPSMSYVRVASHATALRSLDVRVVGVAGGSMPRFRRGHLYAVGPRSAHIADLQYASLMPASAFAGATVASLAPRARGSRRLHRDRHRRRRSGRADHDVRRQPSRHHRTRRLLLRRQRRGQSGVRIGGGNDEGRCGDHRPPDADRGERRGMRTGARCCVVRQVESAVARRCRRWRRWPGSFRRRPSWLAAHDPDGRGSDLLDRRRSVTCACRARAHRHERRLQGRWKR